MFGVPTIRNDINKKGLKSVGDINVFIIFHLRIMVMNLMQSNYSLLKNSVQWDSVLMISNNQGLEMKLEPFLKLLESDSLLLNYRLYVREHFKLWGK